jgi:hypothetical protein
MSLSLKIALVVELAKLNFTYITSHNSTKIAKAGPGFNDPFRPDEF